METGMHDIMRILFHLGLGDVQLDRSFAFQDRPEVWIIFLVIVPAVLFFSFYLYRIEKGDLSRRMRILLATLRCLVFFLVFFCLFRPVLLTQRVREIKPVLAVLMDDSASMREHDLYAGVEERETLASAADLGSAGSLRDQTRLSLMERVLAGPGKGFSRLEDRYDVKYFAFDSELTPVGGIGDMNAEGDSTRMGDALAEVVKEFRGRRLSNILVLSDGRSNRGRPPGDGAALAASEQIPIHTVGVGDPEVPKNIEVLSVNAPTVVLVGDEVIFKTNIVSRGFEARPVNVVLRDLEDGDVLTSRSVELKGDDIEQQEQLYWKPNREGDYRLKVEIPPDPEEQDVDDNAQTLLIRVESARIKVLYVDGYPRWEYRILRDLLTRVENFDVRIFLQSADPDFIQESSPGVQPLTRMPRTLKELMEYHVIFFGDVDPNALAEDMEESLEILKHIKAFVEAGGGFLMQAGTNYSPGAYRDTPLSDILPVVPGSLAEQRALAGSLGERTFRMHLENPLETPEILRLEKDPVKNRRLWEDPEYGLSGFFWYYPVERAKPGAEVLARHPENKNRHGRHVLLATTYYPAGRTMFLAVDSTWRWQFPYRDRYHELFWRKMIRYLAQNKLRRKDYRFDLNTDRSVYALNERVRVTARIRDMDFNLSQQPAQDIKVMDPQARVDEVELGLVEQGTFEKTLVAQKPGVYQLWIEDEADAGQVRHALTSFTVTIPQLEAENPVLDRTILEEVARISGGAYFGLHQFDRLVDSLDDEKILRPLDDPERKDLWSSWWVLLLFTGLLGLEWILRKQRNLI